MDPELKPRHELNTSKRKLLGSKNVKIGTRNIRQMSQAGSLAILLQEVKRH